jgi:hypothetical protein
MAGDSAGTVTTADMSASDIRRPAHRSRGFRFWSFVSRASVVLTIGLLVSGVLGYRLAHSPGVYWSQVTVVLVAPKSTANPNGLSVNSESLISTAGVIAKMVGSAPHEPAVVSDSVTLVGEGIRHGYGVRLPNSGGQFATNFDRAALDVQAAGTTVAEVGVTISRVLAEIRDDLDRLQRDAGVAAVNLIRLQQSPPTLPIYYQTGSKTRTIAITLVLGAGLSSWLGWLVRAWLAWLVRRRSKAQRQAPLVS